MPKDIYEIMLNPMRMRIVQTLAIHETMTTMELCEVIKDVPRTTLYRHISILIDANILAVIAEKKIRGSLERTLALNVDDLKRHNTTEDIPQQALRFMMNTYVKFEQYFGKENFMPGTNKIFFNNTVMMLSDQEFDLFLSELQALFVKYHFEVAEGRKARDISIISSPTAVNENE